MISRSRHRGRLRGSRPVCARAFANLRRKRRRCRRDQRKFSDAGVKATILRPRSSEYAAKAVDMAQAGEVDAGRVPADAIIDKGVWHRVRRLSVRVADRHRSGRRFHDKKSLTACELPMSLHLGIREGAGSDRYTACSDAERCEYCATADRYRHAQDCCLTIRCGRTALVWKRRRLRCRRWTRRGRD